MRKKKTVGQNSTKATKTTKTTGASTASSRPAGKTPAKKESITIDYPLEGEIITSSCYALRITTKSSSGVEVSIDGKEWLPCRESVGFWWFDWSGYNAGPHNVVARILLPSGKRGSKSSPRQLTVLI